MPLDNLSRTIERALAAAGLNTREGVARSVLDTIDGALASTRMRRRPSEKDAADEAVVIDVEGRVLDEAPTRSPPPPSEADDRFRHFDHVAPQGHRSYKLYVPASRPHGEPIPLLVMLHGCKQDPDDFARGTCMNEVAEEHGFMVVYPGQSRSANGSNCWRWFESGQQSRDGVEPSIIADIVRDLSQNRPVDRRRVYVAGLSAGAAMAVILGETYPDVFAAVGAHSGLPRGAAHDVASAFAVMGGGAPPAAPDEASRAPAGFRPRAVPTIVFHGEADATVAPANGNAIVRKAEASLSQERGPLTTDVQQRMCNGRRCRFTAYADASGTPVLEHWSVQAAGHAWFGGSPAGSFAVPEGPCSSRELMRFLLLHTHPGAAN